MIKSYLFKPVKGDSYYISNSGSSVNDGLSAKHPKTFDDISSLDFTTIKKLKFKCGDTFYGNFSISSEDVLIDKYGSGNNPIIDNSQDISSLTWINDSGDYWYVETDDPGWVMLNNDFLKCAQSDWLSMTSRTLNTITFDTTGIDTDNLVGGYVSIREWYWNCTNYYKIISYSSGTITLDGNMVSTTSGKKFIIVNRYQFLDSGTNQWVYDDEKLWIRTSINPSTLDIRKTTDLYTIKCTEDNNTIQNIDFQNTYVVFVDFELNNGKVYDCNFTNSKFYCVYAGLGTDNYVDVIRCNIINIGHCAVNLKISGGGIVTDNTINRVGMQSNYPFWYTDDVDSYPGTLSAAIKGNNDYTSMGKWTIENNIIDNTAWSAIFTRGIGSQIRYNVISNWHRRFTDGGGIYVVSQQESYPGDDTEIANNICYCTSVGEDGSWVSAGIYLDLYNTNYNVHHNVVYGMEDNPYGCGYFAHQYPTHITFEDNIIVGCTNAMFFYNSSANIVNYIQNNILAVRKSSQFCWATNVADETVFFTGDSVQDYNYYFNPYGTIISKSSSGSYNFADFKTQTGQDPNSTSKSNWLTYTDEETAIQEVKLYTNETDTDTTIIAPSGYEDVDGNDVSSDELTVPAHYGLLILKS